MNDFNFSLDNIRTSFLGYNKSEMRSRMSMLSNSFNALSEQLEKEIAKNKKLEDSLSKKNIECYELEKENRTLKLNLQGGTPASNITQINSMREEKRSCERNVTVNFPEDDDPDKTDVLRANMSPFTIQDDDRATEVLTSDMKEEFFDSSNEFRNIDEDILVGEVEDKKGSFKQLENYDDEDDIIFLD